MVRSHERVLLWNALRLVVAALLLVTVISQLVPTVQNAITGGWPLPTVIVNFFSYFTILSNSLAVIVLAWAGVWFLTRGRAAAQESRPLALALTSVATYMIVTGIVYNVLLRGIPLPGAPWTNEVLHVVGPLFLLLDLLLAPRTRRLGWSAVGVVLVFPTLWVAYTLIRGPLVTAPATGTPWWYPYPFLDPHSAMSGGVGGVIAYIAGIAAAIAIVAGGVVWVRRRRGVRS